jgi:uncharacterized protein YecE (DUF72 family)
MSSIVSDEDRTMTARLRAGASGYSFKEWKGSFYPETMKPDGMLAWYSERLPTVEINNTFYQMPKAGVLENWAATTPADFRFAIKAPRRISHDARLKVDEAADSIAYLYRMLESLGSKRGPVLFQLPPFLKKDVPRLKEFLAVLPQDHRAAFEFRHQSWLDDAVYSVLKDAGAALCLSEREDDAPPPLVETASWAMCDCASRPIRATNSRNGRNACAERRGRTLGSTSCTSRPLPVTLQLCCGRQGSWHGSVRTGQHHGRRQRTRFRLAACTTRCPCMLRRCVESAQVSVSSAGSE